MNLESVLKSLFISSSDTFGLLDLVIAIGLPFLLSFIVVSVYRYTQKSHNYAASFVQALFLFSSITSMITLIIGSNIARAFGLVGALSIIRFRNAIKDPIDAVYIFWSLAVGMACGTGFYFAATVSVLLFSLIAIILHKLNIGETNYIESILKIGIESIEEDKAISNIETMLKKATLSMRQINVLFDTKKQEKTYIYSIRNKKIQANRNIEDELKNIKGVTNIHHLNNEAKLLFE